MLNMYLIPRTVKAVPIKKELLCFTTVLIPHTIEIITAPDCIIITARINIPEISIENNSNSSMSFLPISSILKPA